MSKLINISKLILATLWNSTTGLLLLAIIFDCISRYCWQDSVFVYYMGQDLMVSVLLYVIYTLMTGVNKIIIEGLLILSVFQMVDELLAQGSIECSLRELAMFGIGIWTFYRIILIIGKD